MSRYSVLLIAVLAVALLVTLDGAIRYRPHQTTTMYHVHVLALGVDDFHYQMRTEQGDTFWTVFCPDYEPQFSPGMVLDVLKFEDYGNCWSVKNTHPAYLIHRDAQGNILREETK